MRLTIKFCPHCGSRDINKHSRGFRTEKGTKYGQQDKSVVQKVYRCDECKKQFDSPDTYELGSGDLTHFKTTKAQKIARNLLKKQIFGGVRI